MIRNYLKIAYRKLIKQKSYSMINILGLSLGITCCVLILAYVTYELSFDRYHENSENIYRVITRMTENGRTQEIVSARAPVGPTLVADYPEILDAVRIAPTVKRIFIYKDRSYFQEGVFYVDQSIFNVFSFELIEGDPKTALELPFTMVLTETAAKKYFGDENPLGKMMNWDNKFDYQVTGVAKDPPPNSHFTFEALASYQTFIKYDARIGSWRGGSHATYLLLREGTDPKELGKKLAAFDQRYLEPLFRDTGIEVQSRLQSLTSIHLSSSFTGELGANSDITLVYAFSGIALVILLIACINFMNLATARSATRAKEVGLRKVLGAERKKLVFQFLSESFLYTLISLTLALLAAQLLLPYFSVLASRELSLTMVNLPLFASGIIGILLIVGFIAGSYPAIFLSSFQPISALKAGTQQGPKGSRFRNILVVFQFAISSILIIGTLVIIGQQQYMKNKDLGFEKESLLVLVVHNAEVRDGLESFKDQLLTLQGVKSAGASSMVPGELYLFNIETFPEGSSREQSFRMENFLVDHSYLDTIGIEVVRGRGFEKEMTTDATEAVMINETAARQLGWEDPIGKTIDIIPAESYDPDDLRKKTVIGVFKDIHQRSLYSAIQPTLLHYISNKGGVENRARRLVLRLDSEDLTVTLASIEQKWIERFPHIPFYSFFLDDFYHSQHRSEDRLGNIFKAFAILAVLIGCVGLFGLASFMAERRTKEIGIRKILGSNESSIVILLCKEFLLLICIANLCAWPIAYYAGRKWLQNYPYATNLELSTFLLTTLLSILIALLTVGYKSLKAARANPIDSLRYE